MSEEIKKNQSFEYSVVPVKALSVTSHSVERKAKKGGRAMERVRVVDSIGIDGRKLQPSKRFWNSLSGRFGFSNNIFRYFDHAEVFGRIAERAADSNIRICIEKTDGKETLLAVTNPKVSCVHYDTLEEIANKYGALQLSYADGVARSEHSPKIGAEPLQIGGDDFCNRFVIDTPIDGYGHPCTYLSMMRVICTNGLIGYGRAFRGDIALGGKNDDVAFSIIRAMEGFNNEEGFAALHQRVASAGRSWASVGEVQSLYKILTRISVDMEGLVKKGREVVHMADGHSEVVETSLPIFREYNKLTGDLPRVYGLANLDSLSAKKQRTLPAPCTVRDLVDFCSEVATHQTSDDARGTRGNRSLQSWLGDTLSNEFDLEGTKDSYSDWHDFFVEDSKEAAEKQTALAA